VDLFPRGEGRDRGRLRRQLVGIESFLVAFRPLLAHAEGLAEELACLLRVARRDRHEPEGGYSGPTDLRLCRLREEQDVAIWIREPPERLRIAVDRGLRPSLLQVCNRPLQIVRNEADSRHAANHLQARLIHFRHPLWDRLPWGESR